MLCSVSMTVKAAHIQGGQVPGPGQMTSVSPQHPQRWGPLPHFTDGETEGLKGQVVCSGLYS